MASYKVVKWAQILKLMNVIARTLENSFARKTEVSSTYATKDEVNTAIDDTKASVDGSTLILH